MSKKTDFIARINQLLISGAEVLQSKGEPQEIIDRNRMNAYITDESLFLAVATSEEKQELYETARRKFSKTYISINYNDSLNWSTQVLNCLINFLNEKHYLTQDVMRIKNKSKIEKDDVNKIMSILNGLNISLEQGDINMENEKIISLKNCINCHYLAQKIWVRNDDNPKETISITETLPLDIRNNLPVRKDQRRQLLCYKSKGDIDTISTYENLEQILQKSRTDCPCFIEYQQNFTLEEVSDIEKQKILLNGSSYKTGDSIINNHFYNSVKGLQQQLGTNNSAQTMNIDESIDFEKALAIFDLISEKLESLNLSHDDKKQLETVVSEAIPLAKSKSSGGFLKKSLFFIRDIMLRVSSNLVAQAILYQLQCLGI